MTGGDFWTLDDAARTLGGSWLTEPSDPGRVASCVSTDTRRTIAGALFVALRGERTDGHKFLRQAADAGATAAIVDDLGAIEPGLLRPGAAMALLRVADTGRALLDLASAWRRRLRATKFIAVAGSNGKTTTTRLIDAALSGRLKGVCSEKSFNNSVGVPLTVLRARADDAYCICEVGTNAPGELAVLGSAVEPDIAVITSLGREHLEGFGSLAGVAREEASVLASLRPGGLAVVNADAPELVAAARAALPPGARVRWFGTSAEADVRVTGVEPSASGVRFALVGGGAFGVPLLGAHNAWNAAGAVAVARELGLDDGLIAAGLARAKGPEMRLERAEAGGVSFVNDAYNANPESVRAAIETFAEIARSHTGGRRVVVLGDMLEQGAGAPEVHREVGDLVGQSGWIDLAVFVGPLSGFGAQRAARGLGSGKVAAEPDPSPAAMARVAGLLRAGDIVLLKGSRGMALERVLRTLGGGA